MIEKMLLDNIRQENDIKKIDSEDWAALAEEIREFLIQKISVTGGHLGSNLGAVELTMALHLALDLPEDKIVWDVGHQSYTHKILTGRKEGFDELRQFHGLSGFPKRKESVCDVFDTGHSSTSISAGLGLAKARDLKGGSSTIVSVIGDGSLTGGMAYEQSFCDDITAYVGRLAPVLRLPGEEEMRSLAEGALRVLRGQQEAGQY